MPAVTVENPLVLPRLNRPDPNTARPVDATVAAQRTIEGAGFEVWRPFPGAIDQYRTDPFLLLDQLGPTVNAPGEAKGAPWHPHRGFETVTYVLDGEIAHHDSTGGGGVIGDGDTQWMTAGAGLLHDEVPTERALRLGGPSHGVQLWVNLPADQKFTPPRYQAIEGGNLMLLSSHDGGALVRLIAGDLDGHDGSGSTHTPITYAHATVAPGAELSVPWNPAFSAMAYVLGGQGHAGPDDRPIADHELVIFGAGDPAGDSITLRAAEHQDGAFDRLEVLLLGGLPIGQPIVSYGPFVMNTRAQILEAIEDFNAGRLGTVPVLG